MRHNLQCSIAALLMLGAACSRGPSQAGGQPLSDPPGTPPSAPTPQVIDRSGATSHPSTAEQAPAAHHAPAEGAAPGSRAKAQLEPLPGSKLQGAAALEEAGGAVRIALQVQQATPGASRVALRSTGRCAEKAGNANKPAAATVPHETGLGTLLVNEGGEGKLEVTLKEANLDTEHNESLLGKALVVYRMQPPSRPGDRPELAVACAQILPE